MSGKLNVWWGQTLVATLAERRGRMSCTYTDPSMPMFSVAMPTRSAPYPDRFTRPFFHGLLPEGDARRIIAFDLGLGNGGGTDMDLLRALGRDCAGALVIAQGKPHPSALDGIAHGLSSEQIAQRLRDLPDHPLGADGLVRVSLPGVQPKLLLGRTSAGGGTCRLRVGRRLISSNPLTASWQGRSPTSCSVSGSPQLRMFRPQPPK